MRARFELRSEASEKVVRPARNTLEHFLLYSFAVSFFLFNIGYRFADLQIWGDHVNETD